MHFALTEEQVAIQDMALQFAKDRIAPGADEWDQKSHFPVDVIREVAPLGMAAIYVPEEHGGSGLGRLDGALIHEALAYGCPTIAGYISIHNMVTWMVSKFASDEQRSAWIDKLASMEWLASYCLTEPGSGSDAGAAAAVSPELPNGAHAASTSPITRNTSGRIHMRSSAKLRTP